MPPAKITLTKAHHRRLYGAKRLLGTAVAKRTGLSIPFHVYIQDPLVAGEDPNFGIDKDCCVDWEPGLAEGPTSARFAVVDYDADTGILTPPAEWKEDLKKFVQDDKVLDGRSTKKPQFHQVNVWAILQRALCYFEGPDGLGRRIPWGFEGNRLIVVPHAGYGKNAFYDRQSKSLQFYYFDDDDGERVQTCLSTDIVHHEFGHAVLDGVRPYFIESASVETAAFHEFMGDLTAILLSLRTKAFRKALVQETHGDLSESQRLAGIAEQFGKKTQDRPYLRSAFNEKKMANVKGSSSPHAMSEVLTGAMFDILLDLSKFYQEKGGRTAAQAFWHAIQRFWRVAVQPLDFLPPVDVTFRDYALALLRVDTLSNPRDPRGYRDVMIKIFAARGILTKKDAAELTTPDYIHDRLRLDFSYNVEEVGASRAHAYRFLDDNRKRLGLPTHRDILVADLYHADKYARQGRRLPRQLILEYIWREDVVLEGKRFGRLEGKHTSMLCGGTLVFDQNGTVLAWTQKPGTETGGEEGKARRDQFLDNLARRVKKGQIGTALGEEDWLIGGRTAPFTERTVDGSLRIELTPHMNLSDDHDEPEGERQWELSS